MAQPTVKIQIDHKSIHAAIDFIKLIWDITNSSRQNRSEPHNADLYKILGISPNANIEQIKHRYRQLSQIYHPDKQHGNLDAMKRLNEAYSLICEERRIKI